MADAATGARVAFFRVARFTSGAIAAASPTLAVYASTIVLVPAAGSDAIDSRAEHPHIRVPGVADI